MKYLPSYIYLKPDTGSGGGGSGGEDPSQTADPAGGEDPEEGATLDSLKLDPEQQAKFDLVLTKRLEREREKWGKEVEAAREKAKKEAEETRLAEQQQFQELANRRQATIEEQAGRLQELEASANLVKKYEKALGVYRDALIESVSEPIRALLKPMDVADQLAWLSDNAKELSKDGDRHYVGPPPAPGGKGKGNGLTPEQKRQKAYMPRNL